MQHVFVYFLSAFLFVQTLFHQICSHLQFSVNQSPGQNCFLMREALFFISMKCSFPSMVWISHEFCFAKMDNFVSVAKWSQASAFTQFCFLWNLLLNLALSLCYDFCLCGSSFSRCVSAGRQWKKHLIFLCECDFVLGEQEDQEVNTMGKSQLFQLWREEDSHLIHIQNNF